MRSFIRIAVLAAVLFPGADYCLAQDGPANRIQKVLADSEILTRQDLSDLDKGRIVAKHLPVKDKRELAVIGIFGTRSSMDDVLKGFDRAVSRQRRKSSRAFGKFSNPPRLEDLKSMTLRKPEIEDLKNCGVGKCKLRLSAAMIERFRTEINWTANNYQTKANRLYRQMLVDYVTDYLNFGNDALIEYRHKRKALPLKPELQSLRDKLIWINDFAPEFSRHLENFPQSELANVEDMIRWSVVKVAFTPVMTITHISIYSRKKDGLSQRLVVSKQIYANHYFDGSVSLTVVANVPEVGGKSSTYFLHENHARVGALGGGLGGLFRGIARDRAMERLEIVLKDSRRYSKSASTSQNEEPPGEDTGFLERLKGMTYFGLGVIALIGLASLILLITRRRGRG